MTIYNPPELEFLIKPAEDPLSYEEARDVEQITRLLGHKAFLRRMQNFDTRFGVAFNFGIASVDGSDMDYAGESLEELNARLATKFGASPNMYCQCRHADKLLVTCPCGLARCLPDGLAKGDTVRLVPCPRCGQPFIGTFVGDGVECK